MEKVIMFLIAIGFMMSSTACHESLVSDEMTGRNSEVSFPYDNSAAIEDLIQSLDSLNQYYQSIGRAGSGNTQQQEQDPKDSLHVIPAWVDHVGGLVWGHYGWDIGASAGTIISGGDPAATIAGGVLVGLAMHELGSAFASSLAQAIMDCNGYAFVSNPGYIDLSKIDYLPPLKPNDSIPESALSQYKSFWDSLGYRHNVILGEMYKHDLGNQISSQDYDNYFQMCLDKYNNLILKDSIQIQVPDNVREVMINYVSELCEELVPTLKGNKTYAEFVDATCSVMSRNLVISDEKIRVLKDFNSKAICNYCNMERNQRVSYAKDIERIVSESALSEEMKGEIMVETTIGFNSANYWTFDGITD